MPLDRQDAGHTEIDPGTTTVLAVGPEPNSAVDAVCGHLKPLPDKTASLERENKKLKERIARMEQEMIASKSNLADLDNWLCLFEL